MAEAQKTRGKPSITRIFEYEVGEPGGRTKNDVKAIVFSYKAGPDTRFDLATAFGGELPPPCIGRAAAAFGISTSAGNAGNTAISAYAKDNGIETDDVDPDEAREAVEERLQSFVPNAEGRSAEWSAEREGGGPRTSILLEAAAEFRKKQGGEITPDWTQATRVKLEDKGFVKNLMKSPKFSVILAEVKVQKAQARLAAAKSKPADDDVAVDL